MGGSFWVVCCYFNPAGFHTKRANFDQFIEGIRGVHAPYIVVECACEDQPFQLPASDNVIRVRAIDPLWQKERLLNVALSRLPEDCSKVAWLDCDILFDDPDWFRRASDALDAFAAIQPFTVAVRLPRQGPSSDPAAIDESRSLAAVCSAAPSLITCGDFDRHGHTGYAWAARRDWLDRHGLYDACLSGSADHLMAHALYGDLTSGCIDALLGRDATAYRRHFERWAAGVAADVRGSVGVIEGRVRHLWHGDSADRHYFLRAQQFRSFGFDPERDLRVGPEGAWEWSGGASSTMRHWARAFFTLRNEDAALHLLHGGAKPHLPGG